MVNVGDDRNWRTRHNLRKTLSGLDLVTCAAHNVATRSGQCVNLLQGAFNIGGLGDRHRLHRDRCSPAYGNFAHHDLTGGAAIVERTSGG